MCGKDDGENTFNHYKESIVENGQGTFPDDFFKSDGGKKTSLEWAKETNVTILDPDGWDRKNYDYSFNEEKISREEFDVRVSKSTTLIKIS